MKYILFTISALILLSCKKEKENVKTEKKDTVITAKTPDTFQQKDFDILKVLLDEEVGDEKPEEIDYKNYTVSFHNDGDSYSVTYHKIANDDLIMTELQIISLKETPKECWAEMPIQILRFCISLWEKTIRSVKGMKYRSQLLFHIIFWTESLMKTES